MSTRAQVQTQAKTPAAPTAAHIPQPPVAELQEHRPDIATQLEGAARLGHSLGAISVRSAAPPIIQRQELPEEREEEEELQMKSETAALQRQGLHGGPVTPHVEAATRRAAVGAASEVRQENRTGLPDNLKVGLEDLSGLAMDDVRVHYNSSKPADIDAHAFTQGKDIYIAPGQERHLAHEGWHVVQQKEGRVKPDLQERDARINNDVDLEDEAAVMGEMALQYTKCYQVSGQQVRKREGNRELGRTGKVDTLRRKEPKGNGQQRKTKDLTSGTIKGPDFNKQIEKLEKLIGQYNAFKKKIKIEERDKVEVRSQIKVLTDIIDSCSGLQKDAVAKRKKSTVEFTDEDLKRLSEEATMEKGLCEIQLNPKTSRGGEAFQEKEEWIIREEDQYKPVLEDTMRFVHCGQSPPGTELDPAYGKEIIYKGDEVVGKCVLAFPLSREIKDEMDKPKAVASLWSEEETPYMVIFEVPKGSIIYSKKGGKPDENMECGFPYKITTGMIVATYEWNKSKKQKKNEKKYEKVK